MYIYIYIHVHIYIYIYLKRERQRERERERFTKSRHLGSRLTSTPTSNNYHAWVHQVRTPEIDTSEAIVDFQWHFPVCFHMFGGIFRRIVTYPVDCCGKSTWRCPMDVHFCEFWGARFWAPAAHGSPRDASLPMAPGGTRQSARHLPHCRYRYHHH